MFRVRANAQIHLTDMRIALRHLIHFKQYRGYVVPY